MRVARLIPLLLAAVACTTNKTASNDTGMTSADTGSMSADAAREDIGKLRSAWIEAANKDDAATVATMYTDDAVMVGSEAPAATGKAAIQSALSQSFPASNTESVDSKELVVSGDIAYDYGEFRSRVTPPTGAAQTVNGHYLVTLRRQSDGSWKIARHLTTTPPAKP